MKRILVAHDGSRVSRKALKTGIQLALKFGSELYVLSVVPELYLTELSEADRERIREVLTEETHKLMKKVEKELTSKEIPFKCLVKQGDPAEVIIKTARSLRTNLIVTGSHGRSGPSRFLLGSVSSKVLQHAHCPVLVVK